MPTVKLHNEVQLVEKLHAGDEVAFTTLYRHYSPVLYINILRMVRDPQLTEEIVQELFTRIWKNRTNQGLKENFAGYIYRIAQHLVHDFFRKLKRDNILLDRFKALAQENYEQPEAELIQKQSEAIMQKAVEQLSPQQKKVYELVKIEGCTYKKAAEILGISPLTVKEYLVTTKKSIRKYVISHLGSTLPTILLILSSLMFF